MTDNSALTSEQYWSRHNVTSHKMFATREESRQYFTWRNDQYLGYIDLMPVHGLDGKTILDYGCGPGNDLVGFLEYSSPKQLIAADVSQPSLDQAMRRVALHDGNVTALKLSEDHHRTELDDDSVDYIHCSGVLMLVTDPLAVLREFHRIVRPGGVVRLMVYNYDSIWLHLYVAHNLMESNPNYKGLSLKQAFDRSTDGEDCPINRCWKIADFLALGEEAGFKARHLGNAISVYEMSLLHQRYAAIMSQTLPAEHRRFLYELTFDAYGRPYTGDQVAGIDGCYEFRRTTSSSI